MSCKKSENSLRTENGQWVNLSEVPACVLV